MLGLFSTMYPFRPINKDVLCSTHTSGCLVVVFLFFFFCGDMFVGDFGGTQKENWPFWRSLKKPDTLHVLQPPWGKNGEYVLS